MSILDPRLFIVALLALAAAFGGGFFKGNAHGKKAVMAEWNEAKARADADARKREQARQKVVDDAARVAAARATQRVAANSRVDSELDGLRNAADIAERVAQESTAAAAKYASTCTALLKESGGLLTEVQKAADGHADDVRTLLQAWPK